MLKSAAVQGLGGGLVMPRLVGSWLCIGGEEAEEAQETRIVPEAEISLGGYVAGATAAL